MAKNTKNLKRGNGRKNIQRHIDAEVRQIYYDGLTLDDKIALAISRRGESRKELKRLLSLKEKGGE